MRIKQLLILNYAGFETPLWNGYVSRVVITVIASEEYRQATILRVFTPVRYACIIWRPVCQR